ncbi:E3 ubiquitin-protein ligase APD2-like isoform X2 [Tasmannia lanceolata]|uniref:E3 ubiquitin-protein ligase APD2-like isoform X2 n=1 Tax=Tasmannia lanceolata TaxID=3420 RepID=UPI004063EA8E
MKIPTTIQAPNIPFPAKTARSPTLSYSFLQSLALSTFPTSKYSLTLSTHCQFATELGLTLVSMEESSHTPISSSSSATIPAAASTSSSSSAPFPLSFTQEQQQQEEPQQPNLSYRVNISISDSASSHLTDEAWSCIALLVTFWFFASMTLILGFYGSSNLQLGPNCSKLLQANSFFVQEIKVKADSEYQHAPMLYGFVKTPPLDVQTTWSETHNVTIMANLHKEWIYHLNKGSEVNISYSVRSDGSSPLSLVIAQGKESIIEWMEDPEYPNTTLSWNIIRGNGLIQQKILKSSDYYIAVSNLNSEVTEVQLNFSIHAFLYNTTGACYKCSLNHNLCGLKLLIFRANAAVLVTPGPEEATENNSWYVKLSYGPRWITYFIGSGGMTVIILLALKMCGKFESSRRDRTVATERTPLLTHKDDDSLSWGSSYDSISHDEEDLEDGSAEASLEAKSLKEGENINPRRLCVICFDAPRDCFFLPCGHCAACFKCGTRITEEAGTCPICRRKMKKVRKIFAV